MRHAESSPSTALLCILPDIPSRVVEDSRQRTILTTRSGKRRAAHLVCRSIELSHSDSNCRSISQWSRATGPANLLRAGRPERRNMTTAKDEEATFRVVNWHTAVVCVLQHNQQPPPRPQPPATDKLQPAPTTLLWASRRVLFTRINNSRTWPNRNIIFTAVPCYQHLARFC